MSAAEQNRTCGRRAWVALAAGVLAFVALTAWVNWVKHATLRPTFALDLAAFHNPMVNFMLGRDRTYLPMATWFSPGDHDGPSIFRSSHFTPLRLFVLPAFYRLWPHVSYLMAVQSAFVAAGAVALYGFVRRRTGRHGLALAVGATYLAHPALLHTAFNDFREIHLGIGPALFALAAHAERRATHFVLAALLMLSARPEFAFLLAVFPVLNWRLTAPAGRDRRWLLAPALMAVGWYGLTALYSWRLYGVALPHFAASSPLSDGAAAGLPERLGPFLRLALLPGLLAVATPEAFLVALPFVAVARDVPWPGVPQHHLQHLAPALAATFWACTATLVRLAPAFARRPRAYAALLLSLALAGAASFAHFAWVVAETYFLRGHARFGKLARVESQLPRDATVLSSPRLLAYFSGHARVLDYELLPGGPAGAQAAAAQVLTVCDLVATEREPWLDELVAASGRFHPPVEAAGAHLWLARAEARATEDPDRVLERALRFDLLSERERAWLRLHPSP